MYTLFSFSFIFVCHFTGLPVICNGEEDATMIDCMANEGLKTCTEEHENINKVTWATGSV